MPAARTPGTGVAAPASLPVPLDAALFEQHLSALIAAAEPRGGVDAWLDALGEKSRRLSLALRERRIAAAFDLVFSARRRLGALASSVVVEAAIEELVESGGDHPDTRMTRFAEAIPVPPGETLETRRAVAKLRRAGHDFAAEVLHFGVPGDLPLMTRWVWDRATMTGALRELVRGADGMRELPFEADLATLDLARRWVFERVSDRGIYRDVPYWADLVLASAYGHYFRSMTGGVLGADFQRASDPADTITGLLGIDRLLKD